MSYLLLIWISTWRNLELAFRSVAKSVKHECTLLRARADME